MFLLNITFYKHICKCYRLKKDISKSKKKKKKNQKKLLKKVIYKKN
jgi:hypothetical protein